MRRKIILPILIVLILCGGVVYYKAVTQPQPLILTGIVTTNDVVASSQIQGQLAQVLVKEGDTVKAGQLLAVIEPQELRADESYYLHTERGTAAQVDGSRGGAEIPGGADARPDQAGGGGVGSRRRRRKTKPKPTWSWTA